MSWGQNQLDLLCRNVVYQSASGLAHLSFLSTRYAGSLSGTCNGRLDHLGTSECKCVSNIRHLKPSDRPCCKDADGLGMCQSYRRNSSKPIKQWLSVGQVRELRCVSHGVCRGDLTVVSLTMHHLHQFQGQKPLRVRSNDDVERAPRLGGVECSATREAPSNFCPM